MDETKNIKQLPTLITKYGAVIGYVVGGKDIEIFNEMMKTVRDSDWAEIANGEQSMGAKAKIEFMRLWSTLPNSLEKTMIAVSTVEAYWSSQFIVELLKRNEMEDPSTNEKEN